MNKSKRLAASSTCYILFGVCGTITHGLKQIALCNPPSGNGLGDGLTEKERAYVNNLASDFHRKGEILRKLGKRFR